jgi:DMSO reductase family type II enzyme chaperone
VEAAESLPSVSQIYLFLGKCFSYPKEEFYTLVEEERTGEELRVLVKGLPFDVNFRGIPSPSLPQEEFESEYLSSFDLALAGPSLPCPLYESAYREEETSSRDITEELLRFYDHFNVKLSDKEKDYPDHLAVELEFMGFLAKKEADAVEQGRDPAAYRRAQLDFLERHLDRWVHRLAERVQERVREPFYRGVSSFLGEFLMCHLLYLREKAAAQESPGEPLPAIGPAALPRAMRTPSGGGP